MLQWDQSSSLQGFLIQQIYSSPFVLLQPLCCWILRFTCVLIVVLIVEPFRCNLFYRALSVIHLKGTPDSRPPFCCIYYHEIRTTGSKISKGTEHNPGGGLTTHLVISIWEIPELFSNVIHLSQFRNFQAMLEIWPNSYYTWAHTLSCALFLTDQVRIQPP